MRTKLFATLVAGGCLVGAQAPALAQGAAAAPQSLTPDAFSYQPPASDWNAPRLYNEVQPRQLNVTRGHHRRADVAPTER
jgi:hypothetical protein